MRPLKQALYSSRTADKFVVRLPDGMREQIAEVAREHHRSMNSEIIARLERSLLDPSDISTQATVIEQPSIGIGQLVHVTLDDGREDFATVDDFAVCEKGELHVWVNTVQKAIHVCLPLTAKRVRPVGFTG